jgi:hypothetical protein
MNYHIGRLVLSSLCVGDLVRLVLGGVRFAGCISLQNEQLPDKWNYTVFGKNVS